MPEAADARPARLGGSGALQAAAAAAAAGTGGEGGLVGPELLKLAAALRMNTGRGEARERGAAGLGCQARDVWTRESCSACRRAL